MPPLIRTSSRVGSHRFARKWDTGEGITADKYSIDEKHTEKFQYEVGPCRRRSAEEREYGVDLEVGSMWSETRARGGSCYSATDLHRAGVRSRRPRYTQVLWKTSERRMYV